MPAEAERPIAVFDSGVGGLSVLRHIRAQMPRESLLYLADQAHVPYGARTLAEIRHFSEAITRFFLEQKAKIIVIACNTASAAALNQLRLAFPNVPFVGTEPAVKPAAAQTRSGKVGVLATASTFQSERYTDLMARFAHGVTVLEDPCLGLVEQIEAGATTSVETERLLRVCLEPMLVAGVDTLVLGCTHYPFVTPLIERIAGTAVTIIDPAPAVARQTERVLQQYHLLASGGQQSRIRVLTSGNAPTLARLSRQLLGFRGQVEKVVWQDGLLVAA
ncbi:MAG TPA: glutamate racemase [Anaerolineae bacterium]